MRALIVLNVYKKKKMYYSNVLLNLVKSGISILSLFLWKGRMVGWETDFENQEY